MKIGEVICDYIWYVIILYIYVILLYIVFPHIQMMFEIVWKSERRKSAVICLSWAQKKRWDIAKLSTLHTSHHIATHTGDSSEAHWDPEEHRDAEQSSLAKLHDLQHQ